MSHIYDEIPRYVQFTSPVSTTRTNGERPQAATLPLNLVALIVSYLDDVGDIARVTRTSRLLYYMTLPQLYQRVELRSYKDIRFVNGRPEGFGGGSPFMMGLNGLVTKAHAALVLHLGVSGDLQTNVDEFAQGRVPDNTMMLNILLRAATDKMTKLQSFEWKLDSKPLKTMYQGLAAHDTLTTLSLKFPSSRVPRPSVLIPPMPNLRVFKATDIDPLCYCDDISLLLYQSKRLEDVRLHFSPRMRQEAEPSVSLQTYFGRCFQAKYKLPIKHFAFQNFFSQNMEGMEEIFADDTYQSTTFIDTFGGLAGNARNIYVDSTWQNIPKDLNYNLRTVRCNELAPQHVEMIRKTTGLENMYFINEKAPSQVLDGSNTPVTPGSDTSMLCKEYLYALTRSHGPSLKNLLLSAQWALSPPDVAELVRFCPNLEQLGLGFNAENDKTTLRMLLPFLQKLKVLRVVRNQWLDDWLGVVADQDPCESISLDLHRSGAPESIRWICVGDMVFKVGKNREHVLEDGTIEVRREVHMASMDQVRHIEIIALDCLDISADPVLPFSP